MARLITLLSLEIFGGDPWGAFKGAERLSSFFGGGFKGTFRDNFGHWRPLEALVKATSNWFGR